MDNIEELIQYYILDFNRLPNNIKELIKLYFNYRTCFDLSGRIKIKQKNLFYVIQRDISEIKTIKGLPNTKQICKHGIKCYRKNANHLSEYIHHSSNAIKLMQNLNRDIFILTKHQEIYEEKKLPNQDLKELAKNFTDKVTHMYKEFASLEKMEDFDKILHLLVQFEQPIDSNSGRLEYGFECPGFAILMTFILNIEQYLDERYNYDTMFTMLDGVPISGTYLKEDIKKSFNEVLDKFNQNIKPLLHESIKNDRIISINTFAQLFNKQEEKSIKRQKIYGTGRKRKKEPKEKKLKTNKQKLNFKKLKKHITRRFKPRIKNRSKPKLNKSKKN